MLSKNEIKLIRSLSSKKGRDKNNLFIAEGVKLVTHFITHGFVIKKLFISESLPSFNFEEFEPITKSEMRSISFLENPSPAFCIFHKKRPHINQGSKHLIYLDGVRDPGNLGAIIRSADWFGYRELYCSKDSVDAYNPKVVQSCMGSLANVSVVESDMNFLKSKLKEGFVLISADMNGENVYDFKFPDRHVLIMGNEGSGISREVSELTNQTISIPKSENSSAESLNVAIATSILLGFISANKS